MRMAMRGGEGAMRMAMREVASALVVQWIRGDADGDALADFAGKRGGLGWELNWKRLRCG